MYIFGVVVCFQLLINLGESIDCYKCMSINHNNSACDDPFHNNFSAAIYEAPCMGGRKGRNGVYPATSCVKISGKFLDNGTDIIVRSCALDSGTVSTDTELVRMSHCGGFYFNNRYVRGCVQTCNEADGCNASLLLIPSNVFTLTLISVLSMLSLIIYSIR